MFQFRNGSLQVESVPLETVARECGASYYDYSRAALCSALNRFQAACAGHDALVCYAAKANSDLAILNLLPASAPAVVSGGELARGRGHGGRGKNATYPRARAP